MASDTSEASPTWSSWSPLARIGEMGRGGPLSIRLPNVLTSPTPRAGAFWTAGNPGLLAFEADSTSRADFAGWIVGSSGGYRRPLDPSSHRTTSVSASAWQPLGRRGHAIGRASVERRKLASPGTRALGPEPYSGSPFVATDTTVPDGNRSVVTLEGVLSWRLGGWGVGLGSGIEATDIQGEQARIGRTGRVSAPAMELGVGRTLPFGVTVGGYLRALQRREKLSTAPLTAPEYVFELQGYSEPEGLVLGTTGYTRRFERAASTGGVTFSGAHAGTNWVAYAERGGLREAQSRAITPHPPADRWKTQSTIMGAAAQRAWADVLLATVRARHSRITGVAERADLVGHVVNARSMSWRLDGDFRTGWRENRIGGPSLVLAGFLLHDDRSQSDAVAELNTSVQSWTSGAALEAGHSISDRLRLSAAIGLALYTPSALLPAPDSLGPVFQSLIAPELEYYATQTLFRSAALTIAWRRADRRTLWLRIGGDRLSAQTIPQPSAFRPSGGRSVVRLALGANLGSDISAPMPTEPTPANGR